jgi:protein SCO1
MRSIQKAGVVILILTIPASIILFLHGFGTNEFNLPVYYQNGLPDSLGCHSEKDALAHTTSLAKKRTGANVFYVIEEDKLFKEELVRVIENFPDVPVFVNILGAEIESKKQIITYLNTLKIDKSRFKFIDTGLNKSQVRLCELGLTMDKPVTSAVLCDENGAIRGYYDLNDREEVDRLILEIRVLNHK